MMIEVWRHGAELIQLRMRIVGTICQATDLFLPNLLAPPLTMICGLVVASSSIWQWMEAGVALGAAVAILVFHEI